ncbi:MAG: tyrosine-type recombinase/integrase [Desulfocapsa sp.]|nr:tyrosine-type recombinase/integrase [Desulfocapsa sp.]
MYTSTTCAIPPPAISSWAGVDIRTLAEILGHKTLQMVHRYTHLLNDHKLKAVDLINSLGLE